MKATSMQRKGRAGAQGSDGDNVEENRHVVLAHHCKAHKARRTCWYMLGLGDIPRDEVLHMSNLS